MEQNGDDEGELEKALAAYRDLFQRSRDEVVREFSSRGLSIPPELRKRHRKFFRKFLTVEKKYEEHNDQPALRRLHAMLSRKMERELPFPPDWREEELVLFIDWYLTDLEDEIRRSPGEESENPRKE